METTPPHSQPHESVDSGEQLETLFRDAHAELLGTLYYLVGNQDDARDALQEAFLKCWRSRHRIPQIENLRAWVFRITLNTGRDCRKAAWTRRRQPLLTIVGASPGIGPANVTKQLDAKSVASRLLT